MLIELGTTMPKEADLLTNISDSGLRALANIALAPALQSRLNDLLVRQSSDELSSDESEELDSLIGQVDELNLLKARAEYTLRQTVK